MFRAVVNWEALSELLGREVKCRTDLRGIKLVKGPTMDKIRDNLYIGNSHDALHCTEELKAEGITAIFNVARDLTNTTVTHKDFEMYHVGILDGGGNDPIICGCALMLLNGLLRQGHKVLIHCHEGKSRSVVIAAAHLRACGEYWSLDDAIASIKQIRPVVDVAPPLREMFEKLLQSSMS